MKDYLNRFFDVCAYDPKDAAVLLAAYERIVSHEGARGIWKEALALYEKDILCDFKHLLSLADDVAELLYLHEFTVELLLSICLTPRLEREYEARGIDKEIFWNTVLDLRYKLEECKLVKGIVGTFVASWFDGFFRMTRFALGRLQFEIIDFGAQYEKNGKRLTAESRVLAVHIPRTLTPLDEKRVDDAFAMAKEFFADALGDDVAVTCHSWLLYPENEKILPANTNVYKFMKRFDIVASKTDRHRTDLWRLFDTDEKNIDRLPADSSMRRAYVAHLKGGGKVGWGYGVLFL